MESIAHMVSLDEAAVVALLTVIAFFLRRLLGQFDNLTAKVGSLNDTMLKIDKDLSGEVLLLKSKQEDIQTEFCEFNLVWDRLRELDTRIAVQEARYKGDKGSD